MTPELHLLKGPEYEDSTAKVISTELDATRVASTKGPEYKDSTTKVISTEFDDTRIASTEGPEFNETRVTSFGSTNRDISKELYKDTEFRSTGELNDSPITFL